eukprot:1182513-Prorocentrum_minimum.AAC.2
MWPPPRTVWRRWGCSARRTGPRSPPPPPRKVTKSDEKRRRPIRRKIRQIGRAHGESTPTLIESESERDRKRSEGTESDQKRRRPTAAGSDPK